MRISSFRDPSGNGSQDLAIRLVRPGWLTQASEQMCGSNVWNTFRSRDLDAVHAHMEGAFCPHSMRVEQRRAQLAFQHRHAQLDKVSFSTTEYGFSVGNVLIEIPPPDDIYLVQFVLSGSSTFEQDGEPYCLTPGYFSVLNPHAAVRQITHPHCQHFTIKLDKSLLDGILASEVGGRATPLSFGAAPVAISGAAGSFARYVQRICADLEDRESQIVHPKLVGSLEEALARFLLISVPHNYSDAFSEHATSSAAPYYVKRVEQFIQTHYRDAVCLDDLIAASGASERSLHSGFRKFRNTTPMAYLKTVRMNAAHAELQSGLQKGLTVTDIAFACGFQSLGKFSKDYKRHFRVSPSTTLRQAGGV